MSTATPAPATRPARTPATAAAALVLRNARLPGSDESVDTLIVDGRVHRLGYLGEATAGIRSVDLDGRWLIPGLWDNHVHFSQWAQTAQRLDLFGAGSAAAVAALVAGRAPSVGQGETLVGFGFRDGLWPDAPSRALLDAAAGTVPAVLISGDLHACWLNSAALARHGHPEHPTGLLREEDCFAVVRALAEVPDEVMDEWADAAAQAAASRGVVGIVEMEMDWNLGTWLRRMRGGTDSLRVEFGIYTQHLERAIALGLRSGAGIDGTGGLLTVGPYKVITDGSLNTRTAYCVDEYPGLEGRPGSRGLLTVPPEELLAHVGRAVGAGIRPAVHAIGDHANALALDAFERLGCTGSIEHAQLLAPEDVARFARLGVVASVQPEHALDDRDVADRYWAGRTDRAFVLKSLLDAGVTLALGSDAPVAPLDPWVGIAAAVGRTRDSREPWHAEQAVSRQAALAASARGRHRVLVGDVADLAVCEIDPFVASVPDLRRMPVAATLLAGRFTHTTL
ncbi:MULTISPECIES: amidohydrolase family protein [Cryobacterium]|uniref:Amidohydrolase n=1 Tax=Cryobacterium breve TaxID=1259258 RepID=A0ABY2J987_9MICO|nr:MULTISPECIES: amidohydrolase family protein [Cryobacterium]TFC95760.1 amidohydrolase [Cryobacterium sp. TmT3-12]TFD00199.1 amidohydrolase [Cryobacterium breve]